LIRKPSLPQNRPLHPVKTMHTQSTMISNSIFHMNFREDLNETFKKQFNSVEMEKFH